MQRDTTPITVVQCDNIEDIFTTAGLTSRQQAAILRVLTGENEITDLTQAQASTVLVSLIAIHPDKIPAWADGLLNLYAKGDPDATS